MIPDALPVAAQDVVVVGAGIVGAACAYAATRAGLAVTVVDRGPVAGGTTGAGEGNLLVSDKPPGPELELALYSLRRWSAVAAELEDQAGRSGGGLEFEPKGGLIVALTDRSLAAVTELAAGQRAAGVDVREVPADRLPDVEPHLAADLAGGAYYPQDAQLQPMLATARLLAAARRHGARVVTHSTVTAIDRAGGRVERAAGGRVERAAGGRVERADGGRVERADGGRVERADGGRVTGVRLGTGDRIATGAVVNAAGTWGGDLAALAGVRLPILPRRGVILVTQPLPPLIRHKVYAAEYVADVGSSDPGLESSAVVESTPAGTVLIGASRERVGFDPAMPVVVVRRLARQAVRLFPRLAEARLLRTYRGFRPYCPDHLPVIGADPRVPGLLHACGHEGAGIGLAAGTAELIAQLLVGVAPDLDLKPFRPDRFAETPEAAR